MVFVDGWRRWTNAQVFILFGLFFALTSWWRSLAFGFYSDDWIFLSNTIYLPATLVEYLEVNWYARPVYASITWILNKFANGSPALWQVISSGTVLASVSVAFKLIGHTATSLGYGRRAVIIGSFYGAVVLFFSPWMLAVFAWPTGVLTLWSFILFGVGFVLIEESENWLTKSLGSVLVLCGFLSYEAYWFTFIPLLLIARSFRVAQISSTILGTLWYIVPLGLAGAYQRVLVPFVVPGHEKPVSVNWSLIVNNITQFDRFVSAAIAPVPTITLLLCVAAVASALLILRAISFARLLAIVAALSLGVIITAVIHGAAGYGLTGLGVMSRSMAAPGFYFSVFLGIMAAASADRFNGQTETQRRRYVFPILFGTILAMLFTGFMGRTSEWASNKELSTNVVNTLVSTVDQSYLRHSPKDVSIVVQVEGDPNGEVFGGYWELGGAVALVAPSLVPAKDVWFLPARQGAWSTVWDGAWVIQTVCSARPESVVESRASRAPPLYYRIDPKSGKLLESGRLTRGREFGCGGSRPVLDQS